MRNTKRRLAVLAAISAIAVSGAAAEGASATVSVSASGGTMTVTGDSGNTKYSLFKWIYGTNALQVDGGGIGAGANCQHFKITIWGQSIDDPNRVWCSQSSQGINMDLGSGDDTTGPQPGDLPPLTIHGGAGKDTITGGPNGDILYGDDGYDFLYGRDGGDVLVDVDTNITHGNLPGQIYPVSWLYGEGGNDLLISGDGAPDLDDGGPGTDTCWAENSLDAKTSCEK